MLKGVYWICVVFLLLISASLLIGTISESSSSELRQIINSNRELIDSNSLQIKQQRDAITDLIESNQQVVKQSQNSTKELTDRIDKLITLMEANYATPTD